MLTTTLIAIRIWWLQRELGRYGKHPNTGSSRRRPGTNEEDAVFTEDSYIGFYRVLLSLFIETGAIYTVTMLVALILYVLDSNALSIVVRALSQIVGA